MPITSSFPASPPEKDGWPWNGGSVCGSGSESYPKVSIVTPSFNQAAFLEETIRSVLLQGYSNLEYIVVDGGSTDGSVEVIRRYEPWIQWWVSETDGGQADAINKGFAKASGSIVGWLNSDDVFYPGFIHGRVKEFNEVPDVDLIYGDVEIGTSCDVPRTVLRGGSTDFETMVRTLEVPIPQQSALWRKTVLDLTGGLDDRWWVVLDREFFLRVARHHRISYRSGATGLFRQQACSKSVADELRWVDELPQLYREFFSDPGLPAHISRHEDEAMVAVDHMCAQILWRNRRLRAWLGCHCRAFRRSPRQFARRFLYGSARNRFHGAVRRAADFFPRPPVR